MARTRGCVAGVLIAALVWNLPVVMPVIFRKWPASRNDVVLEMTFYNAVFGTPIAAALGAVWGWCVSALELVLTPSAKSSISESAR